MSVELVNRISIKKDGVYINTHSNNDTAPFHSVRLRSVSETINANGGAQWRKKHALKDFVSMFSFYGCLRLVEPKRGEHESITELRAALDIHYNHFDKARDEANEAVCTLLRQSEHYTEKEKEKIIEALYKVFDDVSIDRAAEYYLKNGGGKRFGITEENE